MTDIFLYPGEASPNDVRLRDPTTSGGGGTPTTITLVQASWVWTGRAPNVNAKTMLALAQAAWGWTGRAPNVNAKTMITLAAASVIATGFAAALNVKTMITLAQATWQWIGRPLAGAAAAVLQNLLTFLGVG